MDKDGLHAKGISNQTRMLSSSASETAQGVLGHVVAAAHADVFDGVGHVVHCDLQEAVGDLERSLVRARRRVDFFGHRFEFFAHCVSVERQVGVWAENAREVLWVDLAQHHIAVSDGQGPATPITSRSGHRSGTLGPTREPLAVKSAY